MLHVVLSPDVSSNLFRQYLFPELPLYGILTGQKHFSIAILKLIYILVPGCLHIRASFLRVLQLFLSSLFHLCCNKLLFHLLVPKNAKQQG